VYLKKSHKNPSGLLREKAEEKKRKDFFPCPLGKRLSQEARNR